MHAELRFAEENRDFNCRTERELVMYLIAQSLEDKSGRVCITDEGEVMFTKPCDLARLSPPSCQNSRFVC